MAHLLKSHGLSFGGVDETLVGQTVKSIFSYRNPRSGIRIEVEGITRREFRTTCILSGSPKRFSTLGLKDGVPETKWVPHKVSDVKMVCGL